MAKKIYVGVDTEVPVYEGSEITLTSDTLLEQYFSVSRSDYSFYHTSNGYFRSDNSGCYEEYYDSEYDEYYESGTTAYIELTALADYSTVSFDYGVSSESGCDFFRIFKNNTGIVEISGEETGSWSGAIFKDDTISFSYSKDDSADEGEDQGWFNNFKIGNKTQIGTEIKPLAREVCHLYIGVENIARPIYKAYVGVGGVARPFWHGGAGRVEYYGEITPLRLPLIHQGAASTTDYAFFGGGGTLGSSTVRNSVYAYDNILTQFYDGLKLEKAVERPSAAAIDNYVAFVGGENDGTSVFNHGTAFSNTLTQITTLAGIARRRSAGTNIGNHCMIFAGGSTYYSTDAGQSATTYVYSSNLTQSTITLPFSTVNAAATSIGDYAIVGGGGWYSSAIDSAAAINKDLTITSVNSLSAADDGWTAESTKTHAIFKLLGTQGDAYDKDLIHTQLTSLPAGSGVSSPLGDYALFGASQPVIFSPNLTTLVAPESTADRVSGFDDYIAGAEVGKYALFAGGAKTITPSSVGSNVVTAYTL